MQLRRDEAEKLLFQYVSSQSLRGHCLAVEAAMRSYARYFGEDENAWGIAGLLHDFDYEKFPDYDPVAKTGHPFEGVRMLEAAGYPSEITQAILSHANYSGVSRDTPLRKALFAVDELSGFVVAVAKLRPSGFVDMDAASVEKKLKNKAFAAKVSREDIEEGIALLGIDRKDHIERVISALSGIAGDLGIRPPQ